jgi:hypothetical protein
MMDCLSHQLRKFQESGNDVFVAFRHNSIPSITLCVRERLDFDQAIGKISSWRIRASDCGKNCIDPTQFRVSQRSALFITWKIHDGPFTAGLSDVDVERLIAETGPAFSISLWHAKPCFSGREFQELTA